MKSKALVALLALTVLAALVGAESGALAKAKKKSGPLVVATDADNDWGSNVDPTIAPAGDAIGQELVEASLAMADKTTVNFVITLKSLPPTGGIPEFARYGWDFTVDGVAFSMSGNFTDYTRGVCYPAHTNSCPPPKDPGMAPFFIRQGPCTVGAGGLGECNLLATVHATFDAAAGTITIPIPLEVLKAKPGSKIGPGANAAFGTTLFAAPSTGVSSPNAPHDTMIATGTFVVPK